ncbi:hypothetical protein CPMG_00031 [Prochlorococcus phage MED4-213]|uniref:Uncharacterized protein n=1 Tax=Prochlorococcus phage MED4-213 TaxID=889956 RepID=M4QGY3_9CAUD|nr:L-shaped tail fiber protein assembly [Prochlorococcus phage MED4-213]AGH26132.1 hypothetical protein CPMG_00031 [Prochlorococcus phage MED4-213]
MASAVSNLLIYQGSDFIIDFTVENDNGTEFNLTGYTAASLIKKHYTSSTSQTVTAAVLSPATSGRIQLSLTNAQTAAMKSGRYVYDVVITSSTGLKTRVLEGSVSVLEGVTL